MTKAAQDVLAERQRQIAVEGWTPEHDDQHATGDLARLAALYAVHSAYADLANFRPASCFEVLCKSWPVAARWFKPKDQRAALVVAGALILAEIERLDRAADAAARPQEQAQEEQT